MPRSASPPRCAWIGLGLLMIPVFMAALDMTVLFLAIPTIAAELLPTGTQQLWVLHIGDIAGASLVLTAGRLVDRFGPRRLLILGIAAYGAASALAAMASTVELLILARMLLGAAAVTITPAGMALLRHMFPRPKDFSKAIALFMSAFSGGMALGPPLGGLLLDHFWWGSIFLVNVPVALVVLAAAKPLLPQIPGTGQGSIDTLSVALSAGGIAAIVYGAQEWAAMGWDVRHALTIGGGVMLIALFVRRQSRVSNPLLDLGLFRAVPFTLGLVAIWLVITATAGADLQFAQHLQVVIEKSPFIAGALLVIPALVSVVATAASPVLLRWMRPGVAIGVGGMVGVAGAIAMLVVVTAGTDASPVWLVASASVIAAGISPVFALGTNVILTAAPAEQTGSAQAMGEVGGSLGNTTGLALGGSIAYLGYSRSMRDLIPSEVDAEVAEQATESIGGAMAAAEELSPAMGDSLAAAAQGAFTIATRDAYILAVVGLLILAALSFWGLRNARVDDESDDDLDGSVGEAPIDCRTP